MKNKEFWKGAVAGALVVTCIGTGVFAGTGLAAKGTALGDRKCTSKLAYLEELIDRYYLGDKDEEKLQEGLYAGLLYGLDDPYSRYYTEEEYEEEHTTEFMLCDVSEKYILDSPDEIDEKNKNNNTKEQNKTKTSCCRNKMPELQRNGVLYGGFVGRFNQIIINLSDRAE